MIDARARETFAAALGEAVRFDEPLRRHTSFRIGGPADVWAEVSDVEQIRALQRLAAEQRLPLALLGGGTNVLCSDRGVRGVVMKLGRAFAEIDFRPNGAGTYVHAGAAGSFKKLVVHTVQRQLAGLEFGEGIPGTVGGGLLMNAGAFGGEIASVVTAIEGVAPDGEVKAIERDQLHFGYRFFDLPDGFIVTHVNFRLQAGDEAQIGERVRAAQQKRSKGQPLGYPNAGSIFKNPPGTFAGKLIEQAGLKGRRIGQAQISEQHANFIVNLGDARAADVKALMDEAVAKVEATSGVRLQPEVKLVGEWE
jgi:UDP-N-acetylmuramate dehydrogenase